jgi:hypothetical protein
MTIHTTGHFASEDVQVKQRVGNSEHCKRESAKNSSESIDEWNDGGIISSQVFLIPSRVFPIAPVC